MEKATEELIKQTAKDIFFRQGNLHATTQEIADAAGVNRTLLNYYFGSRDLLFEQVYNEAVESKRSQLDEALAAKLPFREKIERFIEVYLREVRQYPFKESFLITEISNKDFMQHKKKNANLIAFLDEIAAEMEKGTIMRMDPMHFLVNLFSMLSYPVIMGPLYRRLFDLSNTKYERFIDERKDVILKSIFI
ncbi:TetR/AcrR family transcriptional regulator [Pedobacter yulinensis]|uniref:TetR/AcrR family transcriptional regulator n=1 Tax=Pedobacter yulinensis TaxID=2126353 RepID=A0A2T3HR51_9SPHI|nr:TetR/AcrR family transcriptional regulator [Pedobacter yulinensis]PST84940.1 TetR/AcrR family transcriptional regulator [Pedobacter yulinensis]